MSNKKIPFTGIFLISILIGACSHTSGLREQALFMEGCVQGNYHYAQGKTGKDEPGCFIDERLGWVYKMCQEKCSFWHKLEGDCDEL